MASADECWEWQGERSKFGHGMFYEYEGGRRIKHWAHRYSVSLVEPLVDGLVCMHSCDNPPCVNPAHLRQGTQADNIRDAHEKGRLNLSGLEVGWRLKREQGKRRRAA